MGKGYGKKMGKPKKTMKKNTMKKGKKKK